jgi:hypothetical protein
MSRHTAFHILQSVHSRLVIAQTFADIKTQQGNDCLVSATNDLYRYIQSEYKKELDEQKPDFMM